jgi:hypothetical protein
MSLGIAVKGAEGIVLAADSRVTIGAQIPTAPHPLFAHYDNATKLLSFSGMHKYVGAVTYGLGVIGNRTAHSYIPEIELSLPDTRLAVLEYARRLSAFFMGVWRSANLPAAPPGQGLTFLVGGYDEGEPYGKVYLLEVPGGAEPVEQTAGQDNFGMTWGGQLEIASRLIQGFDPALPAILESKGLTAPQFQEVVAELGRRVPFGIPYSILALQDCVDLATFLIRTTITLQSLSVGIRGVGGTIELAAITRTEGLRFVQQKVLRAGGGQS